MFTSHVHQIEVKENLHWDLLATPYYCDFLVHSASSWSVNLHFHNITLIWVLQIKSHNSQDFWSQTVSKGKILFYVSWATEIFILLTHTLNLPLQVQPNQANSQMIRNAPKQKNMLLKKNSESTLSPWKHHVLTYLSPVIFPNISKSITIPMTLSNIVQGPTFHLPIADHTNHSPLCTAPEYLKILNKRKTPKSPSPQVETLAVPAEWAHCDAECKVQLEELKNLPHA